MNSKFNSSRPSPLAQSLTVWLIFTYLLCAHFVAADSQQSVRLPARFGKRAEEPDRENSAGNLIKLITEPDLTNPNRARQASLDPQSLSLLSSVLLTPPAPSQSSTPPIRYVLVPLPMAMERQGKVPYRASAGPSERNGPWW